MDVTCSREARRIGEAELKRLVAGLRREGRAEGTVECYLRAARSFARWLRGRPVAEGSAVQWRDELASAGYAPSSVNAMVAGGEQALRRSGLGGVPRKGAQGAEEGVSRRVARAQQKRVSTACFRGKVREKDEDGPGNGDHLRHGNTRERARIHHG